MKIGPAELSRLLAQPGALPRALLLHGEDAAGVLQLRDSVVEALGGPGAEADMRIERLAAAALRGDPARLDTALRAQGFFPGRRVVVLGEATDALADTISAAARGATGADTALVVTAGMLTKTSALRRSFEAERGFGAVECAAGPMDAAEIGAALARHGLAAASPDPIEDLVRLSGGMDRLSLDQLIAKLALWQHGESGPLTAEAVTACAPPDVAAGADRLVLALIGRDAGALPAALSGQMPGGSGGVGVAIALQRVARQMLEVRIAMDEDGQDAAAAMARLIPPLSRPLQEGLRRRIGGWSRAELERLVVALQDLDAGLRGDRREPERALVERTLLRFVLGGAR